MKADALGADIGGTAGAAIAPARSGRGTGAHAAGTAWNVWSRAIWLVGLGGFGLWLGWPLWTPDGTLIWRDVPQMVVPNLAFQGQVWRGATGPFLQMGRGPGMPFLGDPQTAGWYPGSWLAALAGPDLGFRLHQWVHLVWLGLGFGLLGRRRGGSLFSGLLAGMIAMAATPHLHGLEWLHITAGVAWVPWSLLAAERGYPRLQAICLALMIASGHAYLWVMAPVVALAGTMLLPRAARRAGLPSVLAVPLVTLPVWAGYLQVAGQFAPHGFGESEAAPITAFAPRHLLGFVMPRALRDFQFIGADGARQTFRQWGDFGWARQAYVGILPLGLAIWGLWHRGKWRRAAGCLVGGGLLLSMGLSWAAARWPALGRHVHHPASFIQLTSWGLLLLAASGFQVISRCRRRPLPWSRAALFCALPLLGAVLHRAAADAALDGEFHPLWNFAWQVGWVAWPLGSMALVGIFGWANRSWKRRTGRQAGGLPPSSAGQPWFALATGAGLGESLLWFGLLLGLVIGDAGWHSRPSVPRSLPVSSLPPRLLEGLEPGRLAVDPCLEELVRRPPAWASPEELTAAYGFLARVALPAIEVPNGFSYLGDYNPPFAHPGRRAFLDWLFGGPAVPGSDRLPLSIDQIKERASRLGVRYLVTHRQLEGVPPLKTLAFQKIWQVHLYDLGPAPAGTIMSRQAFQRLQEEVPVAASSAAEQITCEVALRPNGVQIRVPAPLGPGWGVFWPILPLPGWEPTAANDPRPVRGERFGWWIPLEDRSQAELVYIPPGLAWWMVGVVAGGIFLWQAGRVRTFAVARAPTTLVASSPTDGLGRPI